MGRKRTYRKDQKFSVSNVRLRLGANIQKRFKEQQIVAILQEGEVHTPEARLVAQDGSYGASLTSRAARMPDFSAPCIQPARIGTVCVPAKWTRPSWQAIYGSSEVTCPGLR